MVSRIFVSPSSPTSLTTKIKAFEMRITCLCTCAPDDELSPFSIWCLLWSTGVDCHAALFYAVARIASAKFAILVLTSFFVMAVAVTLVGVFLFCALRMYASGCL